MHINHSCTHQKYRSVGMHSSEGCRKEKNLAPKPQTRIWNTKSSGDYLENFLIKMIPWTLHSQCDSVNTFCYCGLRVPMMDWKWNASNIEYVIQQITERDHNISSLEFSSKLSSSLETIFHGVCLHWHKWWVLRLSSAWPSCIGCHLKGTLQVIAKWSSAELFVVKWIPAGNQPADELFLLRILSAFCVLKQRDGNKEACDGCVWICVVWRDPKKLQKRSSASELWQRCILSGSLA